VGVRNLGMGATGVSSTSRLGSAYYNPATIAWADAATLSLGYLDGPIDIEMTDTRAAYGFLGGDDASKNVWRLGAEIGFTTLGVDPIVVRTIFLPEGTGETFDPDYNYLTSTLALAWEHGNEAIAAGVSGKYLHLNRPGGTADSWLLDFGLIASWKYMLSGSMLRPRAGFSMTNLDTGLEYDSREYRIAGQTRYGGGVDFVAPPMTTWGRSVAAASVAFDVDYVDRGRYNSYWALGWEISVLEFFQARAGYQWFDSPSSSTNLSLGVGIGWDFGHWMTRIDYAHFTPNINSDSLELDRDTVSATFGARF